jgi:hypothetical protein
MVHQQTEPRAPTPSTPNPSTEPRPLIWLTTYSTHDLRTCALTDEYGEIEYGGLPINYCNLVIALHRNLFGDAVTCR